MGSGGGRLSGHARPDRRAYPRQDAAGYQPLRVLFPRSWHARNARVVCHASHATGARRDWRWLVTHRRGLSMNAQANVYRLPSNDDIAGLGTGPIPAGPYYRSDYFELEREAIFRRTWLQI